MLAPEHLFPTNNYLFKLNNKNSRKSKICSKSTINILELSGVFMVNFEHISNFLSVFIIEFEQVNVRVSKVH